MKKHLVVFHHGLWGMPCHVKALEETLIKAFGSTGQLDTLVISSNARTYMYDGIELCGIRCYQEIADYIDYSKHDRISLVGYSLGGLIVRYAIGLMYENHMFDNIKAMNYVSFATPNLGVSEHAEVAAFSWLLRWGKVTLGKVGQDLFNVSDILLNMTQPDSIYMMGLAEFKTRTVYANVMGDILVPFWTAAIEDKVIFGNDVQKAQIKYIEGAGPVLTDLSFPVYQLCSKPQKSSEDIIRDKLHKAQTRAVFSALYVTLTLASALVFSLSLVCSWISYRRVAEYHRSKDSKRNTASIASVPKPPAKHRRTSFDDFVAREQLEVVDALSSMEQPYQSEASELSDHHGDLMPPAPVDLTDVQRTMKHNLDNLKWRKFATLFWNIRRTHLAIINRNNAPNPANKPVMDHWISIFQF
ncbi:hypothetical protein CANCADRAFT_117255 [Tortispora caseinolytica NRRL Y-17796]|uniref:DUF676 domain-containing protein n=1 Tax=Tortispora caseinolytica NRRL Y-17796 TaxID=767744 RepID=A0A1E4THA4_9ASCO|nr:hypothetical protein CANCADRAFT_117255 [Tortispora caseinolytica NRRL Y-17796]